MRTDALPVDKYIEYTKKTFRDVVDPNEQENFERKHERYADNYVDGGSYTCKHCNTAFKSRRRTPECPFCHRVLHDLHGNKA